MLPALDDEDDQDEDQDDQPDAADLDEDADMQVAAEDLEEPEESNGERSVESVPEEPAQVVASEAPNQINSQQELAD